MKKPLLFLLLGALSWFSTGLAQAQEQPPLKLRFSLSLLDLPQNRDLPYRFPSMHQATEMSNNFYELGYWGIDKAGDALLKPDRHRFLNRATKYLLSLGLVRYGSELPIPLGVWAHEEYHRAVLGLSGIASHNGNWIGSRWDGTVYGVSDQQLASLKERELSSLLYAYVAGVHSDNQTTRTNFVADVYDRRTSYKNALYLYNAYYVWNYFRFSTGPVSDEVKIKVSPQEDPNPVERDFAGADFTAWAYDMFNPQKPFTDRDPFPGGDGVNRRVGFSDLSPEAQEFLIDQKKLSLINFLNPAIFFVNRIRVGSNLSFNFMGQYAPTPFGNDVALVLPFQVRQRNFLLALHRYQNRDRTFAGLEAGVIDQALLAEDRLRLTGLLRTWVQPAEQGYFDTDGKFGGAVEVGLRYHLTPAFSLNSTLTAKTQGYYQGNPYLDPNVSFRVGMQLAVRK